MLEERNPGVVILSLSISYRGGLEEAADTRSAKIRWNKFFSEMSL